MSGINPGTGGGSGITPGSSNIDRWSDYPAIGNIDADNFNIENVQDIGAVNVNASGDIDGANINASSDIDASGNITASGDVNIEGNLDVTGTTTCDNDVFIQNDSILYIKNGGAPDIEFNNNNDTRGYRVNSNCGLTSDFGFNIDGKNSDNSYTTIASFNSSQHNDGLGMRLNMFSHPISQVSSLSIGGIAPSGSNVFQSNGDAIVSNTNDSTLTVNSPMANAPIIKLLRGDEDSTYSKFEIINDSGILKFNSAVSATPTTGSVLELLPVHSSQESKFNGDLLMVGSSSLFFNGKPDLGSGGRIHYSGSGSSSALFIDADDDIVFRANDGFPQELLRIDGDGNLYCSGLVNMGTNRITDVTDPLNAQDAATKSYVDSLSGAQEVTYNISGPATLDDDIISSTVSPLVGLNGTYTKMINNENNSGALQWIINLSISVLPRNLKFICTRAAGLGTIDISFISFTDDTLVTLVPSLLEAGGGGGTGFPTVSQLDVPWPAGHTIAKIELIPSVLQSVWRVVYTTH